MVATVPPKMVSGMIRPLQNNERLADNIIKSMDAGRIEKWLVHTDPHGRVTVGIMGKDGKLISNSDVS